MPLVSVIITTHDRPRLLVRAIESARAASRRGVEVVVVDDAAADETARACRAIPGINYVRAERNQGVAAARNLGILASSGDYLSFLDDDDQRMPGSLDRQIELLESVPEAGFIYGQAVLGDQDGAASGVVYPKSGPSGDLFWELLSQNFVPCGATVFRRACLYRVGLLDDSIAGVDDWDLWVRLAELYPALAFEQPVLVWRRSTPVSGQGSSRAAEMVKLSINQLRRRWLRLPRAAEASPARRRATRRSFANNMARHLLWESWRTLLSGHVLGAQRKIFAALRLCPSGVARVAIDPASFRFLFGRGTGATGGSPSAEPAVRDS